MPPWLFVLTVLAVASAFILYVRFRNRFTRPAALARLGNFYFFRGECDKAEKMYRKALEIRRRLGIEEGIASGCSSLGILFRTCGNLDRAEEMHAKALETHMRLGYEASVARDYEDLAVVYSKRGDFDKAEQIL